MTHGFWASDPAWRPPPDGSKVNFMFNRKGLGNPAATGGGRPTYRASTPLFNNQPTVEFEGEAGEQLDIDVADIAQPFVMVAVASTSGVGGGAGGGETVLGVGGAVTRGMGVTAPPGTLWTMDFGTALNGGLADTDPHVLFGVPNGAGGLLQIDDDLTSGNAGANGLARITIGSSSDNTPAFGGRLTGHVAFVAIYNIAALFDAAFVPMFNQLRRMYGVPA